MLRINYPVIILFIIVSYTHTWALDIGSFYLLDVSVELKNGDIQRGFLSMNNSYFSETDSGWYYRSAGEVMRIRTTGIREEADYILSISPTDYELLNYIKKCLLRDLVILYPEVNIIQGREFLFHFNIG